MVQSEEVSMKCFRGILLPLTLAAMTMTGQNISAKPADLPAAPTIEFRELSVEALIYHESEEMGGLGSYHSFLQDDLNSLVVCAINETASLVQIVLRSVISSHDDANDK